MYFIGKNVFLLAVFICERKKKENILRMHSLLQVWKDQRTESMGVTPLRLKCSVFFSYFLKCFRQKAFMIKMYSIGTTTLCSQYKVKWKTIMSSYLFRLWQWCTSASCGQNENYKHMYNKISLGRGGSLSFAHLHQCMWKKCTVTINPCILCMIFRFRTVLHTTFDRV